MMKSISPSPDTGEEPLEPTHYEWSGAVVHQMVVDESGIELEIEEESGRLLGVYCSDYAALCWVGTREETIITNAALLDSSEGIDRALAAVRENYGDAPPTTTQPFTDPWYEFQLEMRGGSRISIITQYILCDITTEARTSVVLDGRELALLHASVFFLCHWPFYVDDAKSMRRHQDVRLYKRTHARVFRESQRVMKQAGVLSSTIVPWPQELYDARARLETEISLTPSQIQSAIHALRICLVEFESNWIDFTVASISDILAMDLEIADLRLLVERLATEFSQDNS